MGMFGFGKKPWQQEDPKKRLQGLRHIAAEQQSLLAGLAGNDSDPAVRKAAVSRVNDADLLSRLSQHSDEQVATIAQQRLAGCLVDTIKQRTLTQAEPLLAQVAEQSALADIALHATHEDVQRAALAKLCALDDPSPAILATVIIQDPSGSFVHQALPRIDKIATLKEIAKKAKHAQAQKAAQERYEQRRAELDAPSPEKRRKARLAALEPLLNEAQRHAVSTAWEEAAAALDRLASAWQAVLDEDPELDTDAALQSCEQGFARCQASFTKRRQAASDEQLALRAHDERRAAFLSDLEQQLSECDDSRCEGLLAEAARTWSDMPSGTPERAQEFTDRFRRLAETYEESDGDTDIHEDSELPEETAPEALSPSEEADLQAIASEAQTLAESEDLKAADQAFKQLHKRWDAIASRLPREDERRGLFAQAYSRLKDRRSAAAEERETRIAERLERMQVLVTEAEALAADGLAERDVALTNQRLKELKLAWHEVGQVPRLRLGALLDQFHAACEQVYAQLRTVYEAQDWERFHNATVAEEIIEGIEALAVSEEEIPLDEAPEAFAQLKDLQARWRTNGFLPRERKEELWDRYKTAGDRVFRQLQSFFTERDQQRAENLITKRGLLTQLEDLVDADQPHAVGGVADDDVAASKTRLEQVRAVQAAWKEAGPVPRDEAKPIGEAFKRQLDRFYQGRRIQHQHMREEQEDNLAAKQALLEEIAVLAQRAEDRQAGKLPASINESVILGEVKQLQRRWRQIGFVPREQIAAVNDPWREACDRIYASLEEWFIAQDQERQGNLAAKRAILCQVAELLEEEHPQWFRNELDELRDRWQDIGYVPRDHVQELNGRFDELCRRVLDDEPFSETERREWNAADAAPMSADNAEAADHSSQAASDPAPVTARESGSSEQPIV